MEFSSPIPATPPPSRPPRIDINTDIGTHLLINISWPLGALAAPSDTNRFRAELDTALVISDDGNGTSFKLGPRCSDTFAYPQLATFSGDDVYSPGWEAYRLSLPSSADLLPPALQGLTTEDLSKFHVVISGAWYTYLADIPISVRVSLHTGGTVLQDTSVELSTRAVTIGCAAKFHLARVDLLSLTSEPFFALQEDVLEPSPEPSLEPTLEPSLEPSPEASPEQAASTLLYLYFSWASTTNDVDASVSLGGVRTGANCLNQTSQFITSRSNPVYNNNIGWELIIVDVERARDSGLWGSQLTVPLFADWWRSYVSPSQGSVSVAATIVCQEMYCTGSRREIEIFPGASTNCAHRLVGTATVMYNSVLDQYSVDLQAERAPDPEEFISPSAEAEPSAEATGFAFPEASFGPEASAFPDASTEPEPSTEPLLDTPGLHVMYSWAAPYADLDTGVGVANNNAGLACGFSGSGVRFGGDNTGTGGRERFVVDLNDLRRRGVWKTQVDVALHAYWYDFQSVNGRAVVTVEVVDGDGLRSQRQEANIFPVIRREVLLNFGMSLEQCYNKVGRVRVVEDANGMFNVTLAVY